MALCRIVSYMQPDILVENIPYLYSSDSVVISQKCLVLGLATVHVYAKSMMTCAVSGRTDGRTDRLAISISRVSVGKCHCCNSTFTDDVQFALLIAKII